MEVVSIKAGMAAEPHLLSGHHGASSAPSWSWLRHSMDELPLSLPAFLGRRRLRGFKVAPSSTSTFLFPTRPHLLEPFLREPMAEAARSRSRPVALLLCTIVVLSICCCAVLRRCCGVMPRILVPAWMRGARNSGDRTRRPRAKPKPPL